MAMTKLSNKGLSNVFWILTFVVIIAMDITDAPVTIETPAFLTAIAVLLVDGIMLASNRSKTIRKRLAVAFSVIGISVVLFTSISM